MQRRALAAATNIRALSLPHGACVLEPVARRGQREEHRGYDLAAIRAVHERIIFARERQRWAQRAGSSDEVAREQTRIDENEKLADILRAALQAPLP